MTRPPHTDPPALSLLTNAQMYEADRLAVKAGIESLALMETAGAAAASEIARRHDPGPALILCGPGNNGGDGFVIARELQRRGWPVRVALLGQASKLKGDAAAMAKRWDGGIEALPDIIAPEDGLVVDALFGAGLSRPLEGLPAALAEASKATSNPMVSIDMPSGIEGDSGRVSGASFRADLTITFFMKKPGHVLAPGRFQCGEIVVPDIGIPLSVLDKIKPLAFENDSVLWRDVLPRLGSAGHKYGRGHALVVSGPHTATGAARLGAEGALRAGAGLVTLASPPEAVAENAAHLTAIMLAPFVSTLALGRLLDDRRKSACLIGPAAGISTETRANVRAVLGSDAHCVLDADALTAFAQGPQTLFDCIAERDGAATVLTPHMGEFVRLFEDGDGSKIDEARKAARTSGAIIIFKGPDTVIAASDGRAAVNTNAPPDLATAGSGDVLAGIVTGLLAQAMPAFEAACAAVWLHGEAGRIIGRGLIAEDLAGAIPEALRRAAGRPGG